MAWPRCRLTRATGCRPSRPAPNCEAPPPRRPNCGVPADPNCAVLLAPASAEALIPPAPPPPAADAHAVDEGLQIGRIILAADFRADQILVRVILVAVDRISHLPQIVAQFRFFAVLDRNSKHGNRGRGKDQQNPAGEDKLDQSQSRDPVSSCARNECRSTHGDWPLLYCTRTVASPVTTWIGRLLRIFCVHLHDGKLRIAGSEAFDDDPHKRARAAHAGRIRHARRRDNGLSALFIHALHDGDFLRSTGEESALANVFDGNHRRIELHEHRDRVQVLHVLNGDANGGGFARFQGGRPGLKSQRRILRSWWTVAAAGATAAAGEPLEEQARPARFGASGKMHGICQPHFGVGIRSGRDAAQILGRRSTAIARCAESGRSEFHPFRGRSCRRQRNIREREALPGRVCR